MMNYIVTHLINFSDIFNPITVFPPACMNLKKGWSHIMLLSVLLDIFAHLVVAASKSKSSNGGPSADRCTSQFKLSIVSLFV